jgi:hypothetical protein
MVTEMVSPSMAALAPAIMASLAYAVLVCQLLTAARFVLAGGESFGNRVNASLTSLYVFNDWSASPVPNQVGARAASQPNAPPAAMSRGPTRSRRRLPARARLGH